MSTRGTRRSAKQEKDEKEEEETSPKTEARSKLNQALENVEAEKEKEAQPASSESTNEEDEEAEEEEIPEKKVKVKTEKAETSVMKETKAARQAKPTQQASYIMKLFDRSVNLAKFTEETPLYPLCRAWMSNQPRQLAIKTGKSPEPNIQSAEEGDVVEMPKVRVRKAKPLLQRKDNKINKKELDKTIDTEVWTKEKLFEFHRTRWVDERQKHIENSRNFEEKHFAANLELLTSLIKGREE